MIAIHVLVNLPVYTVPIKRSNTIKFVLLVVLIVKFYTFIKSFKYHKYL